jgi:hypothetical protein
LHYQPVFTRTDDRGVFSLPADATARTLVAVHPQGFAEIPARSLGEPLRVVLQPWAVVEGVLITDGHPGTNQWVSILPGALAISDNAFRALTDGEGKFKLDFAPPGKRKLFNRGFNRMLSYRGDSGVMVDLEAGKVNRVTLAPAPPKPVAQNPYE